jgi:hypothetical protein
MEGLCATPGSLASPVTRVVDGHTLVETFAGGPLDDDVFYLFLQKQKWVPANFMYDEGYDSDYDPYGPAYRDSNSTPRDDFDTCGWDPGRGPRRAVCHHGDDVENGLSECETVLACLD